MTNGLPLVMRGGRPHEVETFKAAVSDFITSALDDRAISSRDLATLYALSVTAYTAANLRAEAVSQVPLRVVDASGKHQPDHPLSQLLARVGLRDLLLRSELAMCFWGHNLLYKRRGPGGRVVGLQWMNPRLYVPREDWHYGLIGFDIRRVNRAVLPAFIARTDGLYMFGVDFDDDFDGVAPAEAAFDFAGVETEGALTMLSFFRNRAIPFAIVQPEKEAANPPDESTRNKLITFLRGVAKGARNAGKTFVSPGRWEWVQLQQKFEEIGLEPVFVQARTYIAMAFRVPLEMLVPSEATYASAYQADAGWVNHWLKPRCSWYAELLTTQLASEYGDDVRLEPDYGEILREDEQRQTEVANAQVLGGYLSLYDAQVRTKAQQPDTRLKGIYIIGGLPMTVEAIVELAQRPQAAPVYPGGNGTGGDGAQLLPASTLPTKLPPRPVLPPARSVPDSDLNDVALPVVMQSDAVQQANSGGAMLPDLDDSAWLPDAVFKELRDCVRVVARRGADYAFQAETLPADVVAYVRLLVATGEETDTVLTAARSYLQAQRGTPAHRAYADVEQAYRAALYDLIRSAFARKVNRKEFGDLGRAEVSTAYEAAFKQGLADVGVHVERLEGGEAAFVKEQAKAERRYFTRLANEVYGTLLPLVEQIQALTGQVHATGDPERQQELRSEILKLKKQLMTERDAVLSRLDLWMQALRRLYSQGQLSGGRNQMLLWEANLAAENCRTCRAAHGQIHRASKWAEYGLHPGADVLECVHSAGGVPVCKCGFRVVTDKARGSIRRIPLFAVRSTLHHAHRATPATTAGYVVLYLAAVEPLAQAQVDLAVQRPGLDPVPVELLHVTLAYAPEVSDADLQAVFQEISLHGLPSLEMITSEVVAFESEGERALVARVDGEGLRNLQRTVAETLTARGVILSEYRQPDTWQPHVTLGYEWPDGAPFEPYGLAVSCAVDRLAVARDNYWTVHELPVGVGEVNG